MVSKNICKLRHKLKIPKIYPNSLGHDKINLDLFNRINPLARGVAPVKVMSPRRHHFSWVHHFRWDCPLNGSQLDCLKGSSTGKFIYSSASAPRRHHFSWGHPFNWGHSYGLWAMAMAMAMAMARARARAMAMAMGSATLNSPMFRVGFLLA